MRSTSFKLKAILGLGHESNGQFVSNKRSYDFFEGAFADSIHGSDSSGENLRYYQYNLEDWTSMGWNYYFTEWILKKPAILGTHAELSLQYAPSLVLQTWQPESAQIAISKTIFSMTRHLDGKTSIRDYDGFRYTINWRGDSRHFNIWKAKLFGVRSVV